MGRINWRDKLGWDEDQLEDLRFAGYAYLRQGKYDIALAFFEALTVLDPEMPMMRNPRRPHLSEEQPG